VTPAQYRELLARRALRPVEEGSPELRSFAGPGGLWRFVQAAWPVAEPDTALKSNWHLEVMADHVQDVLARAPGAPHNLVINVPPGASKSLVVCVFAPAWMWLHRPGWRAIFASGNPRVAVRDSLRTRDLIESEWYRSLRPAFGLARGQSTKMMFRNSHGGFRLAIGTGARVTGDRAHAIIVDDPMDAASVHSDTYRESVHRWWDQALYNRVADRTAAARILIQQRLHTHDLAGHVLETSGWGLLRLPQEYEAANPALTWRGRADPRVVDGDLLFPAFFTRDSLEAERLVLGSAGYAGQHQQRPVPRGGNRFRTEWWRFWSPTPGIRTRPDGCATTPARVFNPALESFDSLMVSVDATFKKRDDSDFVVAAVVGVVGASRYVLDLRRGRMGFGSTVDLVRQLVKEWPSVTEVLIEDKANGPAVIDALSEEIAALIPVEPHGGKESRAAVLEPEVEAGNWYLADGAAWVDDFVSEFAAFPNGRHDDQVDALSQACIRLRDSDTANTRALLGLR
jgi:predicted phage terminase large subunit-like protein